MCDITFNYYCLNGDDCTNKDMVRITKTREEENNPEPCPECGEPMKCVGEKMGGGYLAFGSMSPEQKKDVLAKRSHEHFNKEIKERKHQMDKDTFGASEYDKKK